MHATVARRGRIVSALAWIGVLLLALFVPASPAAAQGEGILSLDKTASAPGPFGPGDTFSYTLTISCTNVTNLGCDTAQINDTLPPPLVFDGDDPVTVVGGVDNSVDITGDDTFAVTFTDDLEPGFTGLPAGQVVTVTVNVMVPEDATAEYNGTITNTATATADNAESVPATADVTIEVDTELEASISKDVSPPGPLPAVAGQPVDITLGAGNESNTEVDSVVVQDPADGTSDPFEYLEFTGIETLTPPAGADTVQVDWRDADGVWHTGTPTTPIPADPNDLLDGVTYADVHGLRFTFTAQDGTVPITPADGDAVIVLNTETRDTVTDIPSGSSETVSNTASSQVSLGDEDSEVVTADDSVVIEHQPVSVAIDKSYELGELLAGESTIGTIRATNGGTDVTEMTIVDPAEGTPDFVEQGLTFDGFTDDVEWPVAATEVSVQYTYDDGFTEDPKTSTTPNTIPGPTEGHRVTGFTVTFTGPIDANSYANLPFSVTADPVPGEDSITSTNTAAAQTTASTGETSEIETDPADLTRNPVRISTNVDKNIGAGELPGVPGAGTIVSIAGEVNDSGDDASTAGVEYLQIVDPPSPSGTPSDFWNHFDVTSFGPTDVPSNADMTVEYWDGTQWVPLAGPIEGPATWSYTPTAEESEEIQGIRYTFTPKEGELLPPGFNVLTYMNVELRDELRDGTGPATPPEDGDPITIDNEAGSEVHNPDAIDPTATDEDDDSVIVNPVPSGPGVDTIDKGWLVDGAPQQTGATVVALTGDERTARISWGSNLLPADSYTVTDPATDPAAIAGSVFDAFDLARIEPITAASDPLMTFDAITSVELYLDGEGWTDITEDACPTAAACDGQFAGYELSDEQRADALGVRVTYQESPTRAERITGASDPQVGSGVARSEGNTRPLDLTFALRYELRSSGDPVLGDQHDYTYNTDQPGLVRNTVEGTLVYDGDARRAIDGADIQILDRPVDVSLTKEFDQTSLPVPPSTTPQEDYPLITATLTATNESVAKLYSLTVSDANVGTPGTEPFQTLNLYSIGDITVPTGATSSQVLLYRDGATTSPDEYSIGDAQDLAPEQLEDVTWVVVTHTGLIDSGASTRIDLTFQLREENRATGLAPEPSDTPIANVALAVGSNPAETADATEDDEFTLVEPSYGVDAAKTIEPAERYENESNAYVVTLEGQPTGTVRTTELSLTDTTPTFWNAFDFTGFRPVTLATPIRQLKVDALVGVTYELQGDTLVALCGGSTTLDDCWQEGDWTPSADDGSITPALPGEVQAADVQGLRISARSADGGQWELPTNPRLTIPFDVTRREFLRYGTDGNTTTPVPSTRPDLDPAPGETAQGTTTDTLQVHSEGTWLTSPDGPVWSADEEATDTTILRHLPNEITVTKSPGNGSSTAPPTYTPGQNIPYVLTYENSGQWPMTGLTLVDRIERDAQGSLLIEPRDSGGERVPDYSFTLTDAGGGSLPTDGFAASLDEATGLLSITVPDGFVFNPGDVLRVDAPLQFRPGLEPGTITLNWTSATSDRPFDVCHYTFDRTNEYTTQDQERCTAFTHVSPLPASPVAVIKSVKGEGAGLPDAAEGDAHYDDLGVLVTGGNPTTACANPNAPNGFYRTPCVPITRPGGLERWQYTAENIGNVPMHIVAGIDTLPRFGDTGVISPSERGSEWATTLVGNPTSDLDEVDDLAKTVHWYYTTEVPSTECNAADIRKETTPGGLDPQNTCYDDVMSRTWTEVTPDSTEAELSAAVAIKFVISYDDPDAGLAPGGTINLTMQTRTAWAVENAVSSEFPIAWNSIASGTQGVTGGTDPIVSPVVEPTRVGVATAIGKLDLRKLVEAPEFAGIELPDSYSLRLDCTSGDESVGLVDAAGEDASLVTVPGDGTVVTYNEAQDINLPLYADCTVAEDPAVQGSTVTYDPAGADGASGEITALNDQSDRTDVYDPALPEAVELAQVTATNTYELAGFSVSKTVDEGGAVDQDEQPIEYDATYSFTASCQFQGQEAVPEDDRTFTLTDGDEKVFDDLPAGSDCTVTETGTGGSASSTITVTENGETGDPTDGRSAEFTLGADQNDTHVNAVAVTNHYTVGSMHLTKEVTGDGAEDWGEGPFTVRLVCTLDIADPTTVYDDTHELSPPDDLEWTVDNLPTGASCTVTETESSGATEVTIEGGTFTVGDDSEDPAIVTVTNRFDVGSVELTKELYGSAADIENVEQTGSFTFELTCTRVVDGEEVEVEVEDAEQTIDYAEGDFSTVTWEGIPTGSECTAEETLADPEPIYSTMVPQTVVVGDGDADPVAIRAINIFTPGWLGLHKEVTGDAAAFAPDEFVVHVECTRNDLPVTLPNDGTVTLTGDRATQIVAPVPEGSICEVVSEDASGATEVDLGETVEIPVFEPGSGELPHADITVTNQYDATGFTVRKSVEGATDQDGEPITYTDEFAFEASCDFLDEEVVPEADRTFTLHQDETKVFTGLPVGAECVVTETDDGSAAASSVEVLVNGEDQTPEDATDTSTGAFVLGEGAADVVVAHFTNVFALGAVTVTKEVTGEGAALWGDGTFEVRLRCTYEGADPQVVYDATHELSAADPTWTVATLPLGAHCDVTEPSTGGATSSQVSPAEGVDVTGTGEQAALVTVTNTFDLGAITVEKRITGGGAEELGGGRFTVTLTCTRTVDGTAQPIAIPGGAERNLRRPDRLTATYEQLPVGARCSLVETDDGGADDVTIAPATVTVPAADAAAVTMTVTNRFDPPPADSDDSLSDTGSPLGSRVLLAGMALVILGAAVLLLRRRRRE